MTEGPLGDALDNYLSLPEKRGHGFTSREIGEGFYGVAYASQDQVKAVAQALRRLEVKGLVIREGLPILWRTGRYPPSE